MNFLKKVFSVSDGAGGELALSYHLAVLKRNTMPAVFTSAHIVCVIQALTNASVLLDSNKGGNGSSAGPMMTKDELRQVNKG